MFLIQSGLKIVAIDIAENTQDTSKSADDAHKSGERIMYSLGLMNITPFNYFL